MGPEPSYELVYKATEESYIQSSRILRCAQNGKSGILETIPDTKLFRYHRGERKNGGHRDILATTRQVAVPWEAVTYPPRSAEHHDCDEGRPENFGRGRSGR